jgi:hypothetical protein
VLARQALLLEVERLDVDPRVGSGLDAQADPLVGGVEAGGPPPAERAMVVEDEFGSQQSLESVPVPGVIRGEELSLGSRGSDGFARPA